MGLQMLRTILLTLSFSLLVLLVPPCSSRTAEEWKTRVVYQIVTDRFAHTSKSPSEQCSDLTGYCGGTFKGIERKLDYIADLGANAIWISPFVTNTNESSGTLGYHGYWPLDIYTINPYFGTVDDLNELVTACHSRDIWVMADLVINNMGYQDGCSSSVCPDTGDFAKFVPFDKPAHYDNRSTWRDNLPKLNHSNSFVRTTLVNWIKVSLSSYDFDGFRFDNIDKIPTDFLEELNNATDIFTIGQASTGTLAEFQPALDAVFDYYMYSALVDFFSNNPQRNGYFLIPDKLSLNRGLFKDSTVLGGFIDNHDTQRFLDRYNDFTKLRSALAYLLMAEWIPFIYYGTEQGPQFDGGSGASNQESLWPYYIEDRSLYKFISTILNHRKTLFGSAVSDYQNVNQVDCSYYDYFYSFTRKTTFVAITNQVYTSRSYLIRKHPFAKGTVLTNIFDSTDTVTVQDSGTFTITLEYGEPKIYSDGRRLSHSLLSMLAIGVFICHLFSYV